MFKIKKESVMGLVLLIASGCIFTFERFLSIFIWSSQIIPVTLSGSGSYNTEPIYPGVFDNIFVLLFFIIGLILILVSFKIEEKE
jgi:hypothetical protein